MATELSSQIPVTVCGSSKLAVYPKISLETTYNMYISDDWMISYPGFQKVASVNGGKGRGIFRSIRGGFLIAVIGASVYRLTNALAPQLIGPLSTSSGEVQIDENLQGQICIVDGVLAYIYHYSGPGIGTLTPQALVQSDNATPIIPGYVSYHATYFLIASATNSTDPQNWYVMQRKTDTTIGLVTALGATIPIQTKPDKAIAVRRVPGRANHVIVFGAAVCEIWVLVGVLAPTGNAIIYQRVSSYSLDNGCVSTSTISASDDVICFLAQNETNSPVIMTTNGAETQSISTDGIDHLMSQIKFPDQSTAFFFREDGHLFYQLTFFNKADNLSLIYDFTTQQFFHVSDENLNYHPARDVVFFNGGSYFVSINDSSVYQTGDEFNTYNYNEDPKIVGSTIPRIRICKTIRKEDSSVFRAGMFTFWIEQGVNNFIEGYQYTGVMITEDGIIMISEDGKIMLTEDGSSFFNDNQPRVDMSISKDGNQSFSNVVSRPLNSQAHFRNQIRWQQLGQANELTIQLRFWGMNRFVVTSGIVEIL